MTVGAGQMTDVHDENVNSLSKDVLPSVCFISFSDIYAYRHEKTT